jgi:hypothetical protein
VGTYADELIDKQIYQTGQRIMREEMRKDQLHQATRGMHGGPAKPTNQLRTPGKIHKALDLRALIAFAVEPDDPLLITTPSDNHVQVRTNGGKVFAEWWPTSGTTMMNGKRGPVCRSAKDVVKWLKEA